MTLAMMSLQVQFMQVYYDKDTMEGLTETEIPDMQSDVCTVDINTDTKFEFPHFFSLSVIKPPPIFNMVSRKLLVWQSLFSKIIHYSRACFRKNPFKSIPHCIKNKLWDFIYPFWTFKNFVHKRASTVSGIKYSQVTNCQCCKKIQVTYWI